jgi:hypothetical protein
LRGVLAATELQARRADPWDPAALDTGPAEDDELVAALLRAFEELATDAVRAWDPAKHPRGPDGKFLSVVDRLKNALIDHLKGHGKGDPFEGFSREQLRLAAKARGLDIPKGASRDYIASALIKDLGAKVKAAKKTPVKPKKQIFGHTTIDHIAADTRSLVFSSYKAQPHGQLLSSPAHASYDNLVAIAHVYGGRVPDGLSPGQVAAIVDAQLAHNQHVTNQHLLEQKIKAWLGTADGEAYALSHQTPDKTIVQSLTGKIDLPKGVVLKAGQKVQTLAGPGRYRASDHDFPELSATTVQAIQDHHDVVAGVTLDTDQTKALVNYTGGGFGGMNNYLRSPTSTASPLVKEQVIHVQRSMIPLPKPVLLERGTGWDQFPVGFRDAEQVRKLVGKTLQEPGFMSTALAGSHGAFGDSVRLVIEAPAGTPGRFVKKWSLHPSENELLLAAGTKFRVLSVSQGGYPTVVRLRVVTPKDPK